MKRPSFFSAIEHVYQTTQEQRQTLIVHANMILRHAKQAIFALHREDSKAAKMHLDEAQKLFKTLSPSIRQVKTLSQEGSFRAAQEEYVEAFLFYEFIINGQWKKPDAAFLEPSIFLGGLSDFTGELTRYAVRQATKGQIQAVEEAEQTVEMIVEYLLQMDLTGHLRQKNDQAKKNLQSLERILYDLRVTH